MDNPAAPDVAAEAWARFWQLAAFLQSEEALALPLDELIATVESGYDALMATLRRGVSTQQAQLAEEDPTAGGGGDGR